MRMLKIMLSLLVLLIGSTVAKAQYNPTDPPEPGVNFTLDARCVPADGGYNISGPGIHSFGSNVHMRVYSETGYRFVCWEDEDGTVVSTTSSFDYVMPAKNVVLIARFEYDPDSPDEPSTPEFKDYSYISIQISPSDAGYIYTGSEGKYEVGSTNRFAVRERSGYRFINWTLNGVEIETSGTLDFTIPLGDQTLVANFSYEPSSPAEPSIPAFPRTLTLKNSLEGASRLEGAGTYDAGANVTVKTTANAYFNFVNWTDDGDEVVSESPRFTYTMPDRNVTLTANYTYNYDPSSPEEPGTPNPDGSIADNMVMWPRMGMYDNTHVQILCETPGATIHYTLDGSTPNAESPVYTEPVFVGSNLLVKAIAYKEGMEDSPVVNYQVSVYKVATPVYSFQNRKIRITSDTPDAIIRYTLDFTDPNEGSTIFTEPFEPEENCRIKSYASKEGLTDSPINIFVFRRADYTIPAPTFSVDDEGRLVIIPAVANGQIYYTLDGTNPTTESTLYTEPLPLDGNFRLRAYTVHPDYYDSVIGEYSTGGFQVETPICNFVDLALTLDCPTPGATLRYTLDGTIPTEESAIYSDPLRLTEDCTVVVRGFKENYDPSETASYEFIYADHQATAPILTYDPEALTVTMTCDTQNAEIVYTTDGRTPTVENGIKYEGPVAVTGNTTYTARAFRGDLFDSESTILTVNDRKVATPTAFFEFRELMLFCEDENAQIRYTTDGTTPTASSTLYEGPIALTSDCTVKFIAIRDNFNDSDVATFEFKVANYQVMAPVITYDPEALTVTMTCETQNAEIVYTTDGSTPTMENGIKYEGPVAVTGNTTFIARAFRGDLFDSNTTTYKVEDRQVATPTAFFESKELMLFCEDENAKIVYTLDGSTPTASSTVYTAPIALTQDCTVNFMAIRDNFKDSDVATFEFKVASYQAAAPVITYDPQTLTVTMTCATQNAEIRYTTDGSTPTATTGVKYEGPVAVKGNTTFTARAFRGDLFDSNTSTYKVEDRQVATPTASFANKQLTLACSDPEAKIVYTLDGSTPTASSTVYTAPIALTQDCTVNFMAIRDNFKDSAVAAFEFKVANYQVAAPVISHSLETLQVTMTCATENAEIRYTTDGSVPTATTGTVYSAPIELTGNATFTAKAFLSTLFDSDATVYQVTDMKLPTPTAAYGKRSLTLTCKDQTAGIRYTTDGSAPTANSTLYAAPIPLSADCTVRFIATKDNYAASEEGSYKFVLADWQVAMPTITPDYANRKVTIEAALPVSVAVKGGQTSGSEVTMDSPATVDVEQAMESISAVALAQDDDHYNSIAASLPVVFHRPPTIDYNGHTISLSLSETEPAAAQARINLYVDGKPEATGSSDGVKADISDFCNVKAYVESETAFFSDPIDKSIDFFNTGRMAGARNGHRLAEAIGTWGDSYDSYTYLHVKGELNRADMDSIASLKKLTTLRIDSDLTDEDYSNVFSATRIETLCSNAFPDGMISGMPRLTTLIWGNREGNMPEGVMAQADNPNILLWVSDAAGAPADAVNLVWFQDVDFDAVAASEPFGTTGSAKNITLQYGYPFNALMPVEAGHVELTKEFTLPTAFEVCGGWETLTLPFTPDKVIHESAGEIVPFNAWDSNNLTGPKPFWLYSADGGDWMAASGIEEGIPYIISMPNSEEYVADFNLAGKVTFSASDVTIGYESPAITDWKDGSTFEGTFMPVEEEGILSLNVNTTDDGSMLGSKFVDYDVTLPFGAFVRTQDSRRSIPVFGDGSGVSLPTVATGGLVVETPAPGMLCISSGRDRHIGIFTPEGATVRTLSLKAGKTQIIEGLTRGIYICGEVKVMVK